MNHPENTRRRQELRGPRHALIGVLLVVAALAIVAIIRLSVSTGMLVVLAASQAVAAGLLAGHFLRARFAALMAALLALAWGVEQILVLDTVTWFQLSLVGVGAFEALLVAGCTPRDRPKKPTPRDRPGRRL